MVWRPREDTPKRQTGDGRGERTAREGEGRWRNGQKDAWCSRWCEKQGEEEGGSLCRPADRKASFAEADRWGILRLKTGENNPTGNETNSIKTSRFSGPDLLQL